MAGFVASDEQWERFERNWNETLKKFNVSLFHMKEFAHFRGDFAQFKYDPKRREWFLAQLLSHIKLRVRHSCGHAVMMDAFRNVSETYDFEQFRITPYSLAGRTCIASVSNWAKKWSIAENQIRHVFEDGSKGKGTLALRAQADKKIAPIFKKKSESVPLQAADLFAYEMLLSTRDILTKGADSWEALRYPIRQLGDLLRDPYDWGIYETDDLTALCQNAGILRKDLNPAAPGA